MRHHEHHYRFPDLYAAMRTLSEHHPFVRYVVRHVAQSEEQGYGPLHEIDLLIASLQHFEAGRHHLVRLMYIQSEEELQRWIVLAHLLDLYRRHPLSLVHDENHGFDVDLVIGDQVFALHLVDEAPPHFFPQSQEEEFAAVMQLAERLFVRGEQLSEHDRAHHQLFLVHTPGLSLYEEMLMIRALQNLQDDHRDRLMGMSGMMLLDSSLNRKRTRFLPFHEGNEYLEQWLDKTH